MAAGSSNVFPKVILAEQGSTPGDPGAGNQALFLKSADHLPYLVNHAGTVSAVGGGGGLSVTTKGDLQGYDTAANRVPVGSNGQVLIADSTQALGLKWGAAASGGLTAISTQSGAAASYTFSTIAGTYSGLWLSGDARSDTAALNTGIRLQVNSDTGANYDYQFMNAGGGATAETGGVAQTSWFAGNMTGATGPTSTPGPVDILLPIYAGSTLRKTMLARAVLNQDNTLGNMYFYAGGGTWRNTAAITTITVFPAAGSFIAGSSITLYGLP